MWFVSRYVVFWRSYNFILNQKGNFQVFFINIQSVLREFGCFDIRKGYFRQLYSGTVWFIEGVVFVNKVCF